MAKNLISLSPYLKPAMKSISWDKVHSEGGTLGRPYILTYCNIVYILRRYEKEIHKKEDLIPLITAAAHDTAELAEKMPKSEMYFRSCVVLHIFINAYIELRHNANTAFGAVRHIGETEHCSAVAVILDGEQIE